MSKPAKFAKRNIAKEITDAVIAALESGTKPWVKPWNVVGEAVPVNPVSKTQYRGANFMWLMMASNGFSTNRWITLNQASKLGIKLKRLPDGKKNSGMPVIFWKQLSIPDRDAPKNADGSQPTRTLPLLKHYTVFNLDQFEECAALKKLYPTPADKEAGLKFKPVEWAETLLKAVGTKTVHRGNKCFFSPKENKITMVPKKQFKTIEGYYVTRFHEEGHASGHSSRLDRLTGDKFGSAGYAQEELVAELTAAMLACHAGLNGDVEHHASYIDSWLKVLREDEKAIVRAGSMAQKAVDEILGYLDKQQDLAA